MRTITLINPDELSPPRGFAHATACDGLVWLGGQISSDGDGRVLFAGDLAAQFRQAMTNVGTALIAAGCRPEGVVKLTYYVTDVPSYRRSLRTIGAAYREVMGKHYPATSLFGVAELFEPDAMIEIECIAVQGEIRVRRASRIEEQEATNA